MNEGNSIAERRILLQAANLRYACLRDGGVFWSWVYFEQLVNPEGEMGSLAEIPRSSGEGSSRERDALQDILRWSVGRFAKLTDVVGELSNYLSTVSESEAAGKQRVEEMIKKLLEMSNAVVGLGASHSFVADETARNQKAELKHLENLVWRGSGSGKIVNTSLKELVTGVGRVLGQIDGQLSRNTKTMEENGKHLAAVVENLVEIKTGIQALVQKATFSGSGGTPTTPTTPVPPVNPVKQMFPPPPPHLGPTPPVAPVRPNNMPIFRPLPLWEQGMFNHQS